ncbi:MAG: stage V sporulation protein AD [Oscillospiraceae bacterium]
MAKRIGKYTLQLDNPPSIIGFAGVASKKEAEGPLGKYIDIISIDPTFGEKTWEKAESIMQKQALTKALSKAQLAAGDLNYIFAGDLLNQCISSTYGLRETGVPFIGLYGACSTMAESIGLAALFVEAGFADKAGAVTSSHFCAAERQFRFPLDYGGQRTPTAQWTVTGSGGAVVSNTPKQAPYVKAVTFGTIEDLGITDVNNMGAAMAPAAMATISNYFSDTASDANDVDLILTGDLGSVGSELLYHLMEEQGYNIRSKHKDCGNLIYYAKAQDVHAGGSGCGCSATVLCSYILPQLVSGDLKNVLFVATGALMSPTSVQQGESIPGVAHLVHLTAQ